MFRRLKLALRSDPRFYRAFVRTRNRVMAICYGIRKVPATSYLHPGARISRDLAIGEYSSVGPACIIGPHVTIGRYVLIAARVAVVGADHSYDQPGTPMYFSGRPPLPHTVIEDDVWIGHAAVIMAGSRIGHGSIIAACAVVTKDVPPYEIWGGIPARKLGDRFTEPVDRQRHDQMLAGPLVEGTHCEFRF